MKIIIAKKNKARFKKLFKALKENEARVFFTDKGIFWAGRKARGVIYKKAFDKYPDTRKKCKEMKQFRLDKKSDFNEWFKSWEELTEEEKRKAFNTTPRTKMVKIPLFLEMNNEKWRKERVRTYA
ncbi:hypothetical protein KY314_01665 [Candidatus Woesearchaeota archaeon]|nr:hypothetical protein [Candidatus Woesearchaeota archaeon]